MWTPGTTARHPKGGLCKVHTQKESKCQKKAGPWDYRDHSYGNCTGIASWPPLEF